MYCFDLRLGFEWYGELHYSGLTESTSRFYTGEMCTIATLNIKAKLGYTSSRKVAVGETVDVMIYVGDERAPSEYIGMMDKYRGALKATLWLPWEQANYLQYILSHGAPEMLALSGSDMYRRSASVRRISLQRYFDTEA